MSNERRVLISVTLLALVLRIAWVLSLSREGFPFSDTIFYHVGAQTILKGQGLLGLDGAPTGQWPPGYSTILAGIYWVFGVNPRNGEIFNALCSAACVPMLYFLVRPRFGRRVATIAAIMLCLMPGVIFWTDLLVTESVITMMFLGFYLLVMKSKPTWGWALGLGAYVGLAVLIRGEAPVWMLVPLVIWWRQAGAKVAITRMAVAAVALVVLMVPWTVRNYSVFHSFVPLSLNSSATLWSGHNPAATGAQTYPTSDQIAALGGGAVGAARELAVANGLRREAVSFMVHHPVTEFSLIPRKLVALARGDSYAFEWLNQVPYSSLNIDATWFFSAIGDAAWFSLLALCIVGAFGLGRRLWRTPLMVGIATSFITALVMYGFVYYGNYRYHIPYEPLMIVVAALVIDRGWKGLVAARAGDADALEPGGEASDPAAPTDAEPRPDEMEWSPGGESNS